MRSLPWRSMIEPLLCPRAKTRIGGDLTECSMHLSEDSYGRGARWMEEWGGRRKQRLMETTHFCSLHSFVRHLYAILFFLPPPFQFKACFGRLQANRVGYGAVALAGRAPGTTSSLGSSPRSLVFHQDSSQPRSTAWPTFSNVLLSLPPRPRRALPKPSSRCSHLSPRMRGG